MLSGHLLRLPDIMANHVMVSSRLVDVAPSKQALNLGPLQVCIEGDNDSMVRPFLADGLPTLLLDWARMRFTSLSANSCAFRCGRGVDHFPHIAS